MSRRRIPAGLLVGLLLAACGHNNNPAPVVDGANGVPRPMVNPAMPPSQNGIIETAGGRVIVQPGETLYAISRRSGVPVRSLIDANSLQPPFRVQAGQALTIPSTRQHIVQPGETLYSVARRYGVEAASLARGNHIDPPYTIKLGQPLLLPPPAAPVIASAPQPSGPVLAPLVPPPSGSGVTATALPPPAGSPTPLAPPASPPPPAAPEAAANPPAAAPAQPAAPPPIPPIPPSRPVPAPAPVASPPPDSGDEDTAPPAGATVSPPEPESGAPAPAQPSVPSPAVAAIVENHRAPTGQLFAWPVSGRIISTYGPASGGTHNDGINIAAPAGTTVVAAESGTIAYAGNELRGFGNLLLIKHDGGWVTAYAHNQVLLVKKGDKVRRGQAIARVGNTGGVGEPQLHFELRNGTKAVDPLDHLPQLTADN